MTSLRWQNVPRRGEMTGTFHPVPIRADNPERRRWRYAQRDHRERLRVRPLAGRPPRRTNQDGTHPRNPPREGRPRLTKSLCFPESHFSLNPLSDSSRHPSKRQSTTCFSTTSGCKTNSSSSLARTSRTPDLRSSIRTRSRAWTERVSFPGTGGKNPSASKDTSTTGARMGWNRKSTR